MGLFDAIGAGMGTLGQLMLQRATDEKDRQERERELQMREQQLKFQRDESAADRERQAQIDERNVLQQLWEVGQGRSVDPATVARFKQSPFGDLVEPTEGGFRLRPSQEFEAQEFALKKQKDAEAGKNDFMQFLGVNPQLTPEQVYQQAMTSGVEHYKDLVPPQMQQKWDLDAYKKKAEIDRTTNRPYPQQPKAFDPYTVADRLHDNQTVMARSQLAEITRRMIAMEREGETDQPEYEQLRNELAHTMLSIQKLSSPDAYMDLIRSMGPLGTATLGMVKP